MSSLRNRKPNTNNGSNSTLNAIQQQLNAKQLELKNESPYKFENFRSILKFPFLLVTSTRLLFISILVVRLLSALVSTSFLYDCDETFNYWEPTHFLVFGNGFQTWEYSPAYGLRSYAYILIQAIPAKLFQFIFPQNKIFVFFGVRCFLALISTICETYLCRAISKRYGSAVSLLTLTFLLISPGLFIASTSYLPSTLSMYGLTLALGAWIIGKFSVAVPSVAFATLLGWPFCAVSAIPLALHSLYIEKLFNILKYAILSLVSFLVPCVLIDFFFYRKILIAVANIIIYNVFGGSGPDLYGVEPWHYYVRNCFLNFNFIFIFAALSIPVLTFSLFVRFLKRKVWKSSQQNTNAEDEPKIDLATFETLLFLFPMYIWFLIMSRMAHKEERFLYIIYPQICFAAALCLEELCRLSWQIVRMAYAASSIYFAGIWNLLISIALWLYYRDLKVVNNKIRVLDLFYTSSVKAFFIGIILIFSLSRSYAMYKNYTAPLYVWSHLYYHEKAETGRIQNVCVGKEWYRFPSNFFMPEGFQLQYIESGFTGQLPKPYEQTKNATWIIPTNMNDENKQELSRYISVSKCDYLVEFELHHQSEERFSKNTKEWKVIFSSPFLDQTAHKQITSEMNLYSIMPKFSDSFHSLFRAFYIPYLSEASNTYSPYFLFKKI